MTIRPTRRWSSPARGSRLPRRVIRRKTARGWRWWLLRIARACRSRWCSSSATAGGAYEQLREEGVEFLAEPFSPPWGGARCFAVDPDGYLVELEEPA